MYLDEQLELAARRIGALRRNVAGVRGLRLVYEPGALRFFQARFEQV